jgi:exoribonuclease R
LKERKQIDTMNYFPEYPSLTDSSFSILHFENQKDIENNRAIFGDEVYLNQEQQIIGIHKRNMQIFTGILYFDSTTKYGITKNGNILYLCKSIHPKHGNFYVSSSKKERTNMYIRFQFHEWKTTQRLPHGSLIEYIGNVGNEHSEYEMLRSHHNLYIPRWKVSPHTHESSTERFDYEVVSIDPLGSKDIDDAFHIEWNETECTVGVHIASPTVFFESQEDWNRIFLERISTIYLPHKNYPMLPSEYAENKCSLLEDKIRPAISVLYRYEKEENGWKWKGMEIRETYVKNRKNYAYEEESSFFRKDKQLKKLREITLSLSKQSSIDSHKLVEYWMIFTNAKIAEYCNQHYPHLSLLRICPSSNIVQESENIEEWKLFLQRKEWKSAFYAYYDSTQSQSHEMLQLTAYTHFTSPIRRCVDFYVHLVLRDKITERIDIIPLQEKMKRIRKLDRDIQKMKFIFNTRDEQLQDIYDAYILDIDSSKLNIYIPSLNLEEKIYWKDRKGYHELQGFEFYMNEENEPKIRKEEQEWRVGSKIQIRLYLFRKEEIFHQKIKIQWIV